MTTSASHVVLLPTYNTGPRLREVVAEVLRHWQPIIVVVDGSTDGSEQPVLELAKAEPALTVLRLAHNSGKGAAVLAGAGVAHALGFTHALVMDADGQHPAGSIAEFMAVSHRHPDAMVLGRPIFPDNIPAARLHGRKLSVWLVRLELLGSGIADPLFGFRIYPIAPLLAVLGPRRGGRRYDFDTESSVRLCWDGVPPRNLTAPVRYFSRAEGGVSHFRYVRDNVTLIRLHLCLLAELVLWRWPAVQRHRRRWNLAGAALTLTLLCAVLARATDSDTLINSAHRLAPDAPEWHDFVAASAHQTELTADFTERRYFPFKREPVELAGEVRFSATRGLSLHYTAPEDRTIILDAKGMLIRGAADEKALPADPRVRAANDALLHLLRFDFVELEKDFEIFGERIGASWTLVILARDEATRRGIRSITVAGEAMAVRRIELRHSSKQYVEIIAAPPRPPAAFTDEEVKRYFR